jgi:hypothetical protein
MSRQLILHCGPMKTGSTAIQDALLEHRTILNRKGISVHHIRARSLHKQLDQVLTAEQRNGQPVVLLSSEFFGQHAPESLRPILDRFPAERHAILVARPLRELYPSLFLQNLKGSSRRITSFRTFLDHQLQLDLNPDGEQVGQVMNAPVLDARLQAAGCTTHWLSYDRHLLLARFAQQLSVLTGQSLMELTQPLAMSADRLSPRRSLRMELAGLARLINVLNRRGWINDRYRERLLGFCLDASDQLRLLQPNHTPLSASDRQRCDRLDQLINQPFLNRLGLAMLPSVGDGALNGLPDGGLSG